MNTADLYNALLLNDDTGKKAKLLLFQTHWFTVNAIFDPRSGEALPQPLTSFCKKLAFPKSNEGPLQLHDRLWRITEHARAAVEHLIRSLNENPKREHALLPIRAVKELDAVSFIKLSQRPGRNIREKLSGKPYLQAVRRYQSIDLPENRLLKAFAVRLHELLTIRKECLGRVLDEGEDPLLSTLDSWLRSDEARSIARWENLPPNNTLLSHRDYRRVWDAWTWLQSLDDDVDKDFSNLNRRQQVMTFWQKIAQFRFSTDTIMAEMPIVFDYENFTIDTWGKQEIFMTHGEKKRYQLSQSTPLPNVLSAKENPPQETQIHVPVCVDFSSTTPVYSIGEESAVTPELFVWQKWENEKESYDLISPNAEAITLSDKIKTVQPKYLFQEHDDIDKGIAEQAAFSFAQKWHKVFCNDTLIWLVPDLLNDFDLEIVRRNINSVFTDAQPLPRSIAAIYQFVDFSKIKSSGFPVTVIDQVGGMLSATKLTARFDPKLKELVPETYGYAWERHPSKIIENHIGDINDFHTVNADGTWGFRKKNNPAPRIDERLKKLLGIGNEFYINLVESPVLGGFKVYSLQCRAGNTPLWYDHLPELSTRIGLGTEFYFVKKAKIAPQRGRAVSIPIDDSFILPAHTPRYEFPLYRGSGKSQIRYTAVLESRDFPLGQDTKCHLEMFYTYGADNPYNLFFVPENMTRKKYEVRWVANDGKIDITTLPVPIFPPPHSWTDYFSWPRRDGDGVSDLFDWTKEKMRQLAEYKRSDNEYLRETQRKKSEMLSQIQQMSQEQNDIRAKFVHGLISSPVKRDKNDDEFCRARLDDGSSVFIPPHCLTGKIDTSTLYVGQDIWLCVKLSQRPNRDELSYMATFISITDNLPPFLKKELEASDIKIGKIKNRIERISPEQLKFFDQKTSVNILRGMQYPIGTLWSNGRSLSDAAVPNDFRDMMVKWLKGVEENIDNPSNAIEYVNETIYLCCCMHQDCPQKIVEKFLQMNDDNFVKNHRNIAMLIGSGKLSWQKQMLTRFVGLISRYNFLLRDLANILWRTENIVFSMTDDDCNAICSALNVSLDSLIGQLKIKYPPTPHDIEQIMESKHVSEEIAIKILTGRYVRPIVMNLEILLALLRLRKEQQLTLSQNLLPNERVNLNYLNKLRNLSQILTDKKLILKTRLSMNVEKPEAFKDMPDLLYALYMYLTGDSGANTIRIISVDEQVDEQEE